MGIRRWREELRLWRLRRWRGVRIGDGCRIDRGVKFDLTGGGSISVGDEVEIWSGAIISTHGGNIEIGDEVYVGPYCVLYGHGGLKIGKGTMVAAHTVVVPANHRFDLPGVPLRQQPMHNVGIEIGEDCWIGAGVRVLDGVKIGAGCVIGAGAVVTRSVPGGSVAMGVPARVVSKRADGGARGEGVVG